MMHLLLDDFLGGGSNAATIACKLLGQRQKRSLPQWGPKPNTKKTHLIENVLQFVLCQGTALDVFDRSQLLGHALAILLPHRCHSLLGQLLLDARLVAQIGLGADDQARDAGAVVVHFGEPFLADVFERGGGGDGEADEEDVGLGVGEGAQAVVVFLAGCVEEAESVGLVSDPGVVRNRSRDRWSWARVVCRPPAESGRTAQRRARPRPRGTLLGNAQLSTCL